MNPSPRTSRKFQVLSIAAVLAVLIAVTGALIGGQAESRKSAPEPNSIDAVAAKLAQAQALDRARINVDLAAAAEVAHEHLGHTLQGLASAVPLHETAQPFPATQGDVDQWKQNLADATSALEAVEEGTSEQAVTREAFIGAAQLLHSAAVAYERLLADPDKQQAHATTVAERRDTAVRLWQAGAAQLDTLVIESGEGHVHVFLAPNGDPEDVPEEFRGAEGHE